MHILASTPMMVAFVPGIVLIVLSSFVGVWWVLRTRDATTSTTTPALPQGIDPYEVAYLKGGIERVLNVVTMDLSERGYLHVSLERFMFGERVWIRRASTPPKLSYLGEMERAVFDHVPSHDLPLEEVLTIEALNVHAYTRCQAIEQDVVTRGLLHAPHQRKRAQALKISMGVLSLIWTGLTLMSDPEHPGLVLGVCALGLVGLVWGIRIGWLTDLGRRYMSALNHAHQALRRRAATHTDLHVQYNTLLGALYNVRDTLNSVHRAQVERR